MKVCHLVQWSQTRAQDRRSCDGGDDVTIHGPRWCHCIESMKIVYLRILRHSCKFECSDRCSRKNAPFAKPVTQNSGQNQRQMCRQISQNKRNKGQSNAQTAESRGKTPGAIWPAKLQSRYQSREQRQSRKVRWSLLPQQNVAHASPVSSRTATTSQVHAKCVEMRRKYLHCVSSQAIAENVCAQLTVSTRTCGMVRLTGGEKKRRRRKERWDGQV